MPMDGTSVNFPSENDPLVHVTAVYNVYREYYYQPQAVMMICYGGTITDVTVKYICQGFENKYPEFEEIAEDDFDVFQHIITLIEYSPTNNTIYHRIRAYRSDRVLQARYGSPILGQCICFSGYVNGTWVDRQRSITS